MEETFPDEETREMEEESVSDEEAREEKAREEEDRQRQKKLEDHQTLENLLQQERFVDALLMSLDLAQPYR